MILQILLLFLLISVHSIDPLLPKCLTFEEPLRKCEHVHSVYKTQRLMREQPIKVDWSNVVILMIMHKSAEVDALIKGHFDTWLKQIDGMVEDSPDKLDIVFITDENDKRLKTDILPDANSISAKTHVYKSPAKFDDKHIRFKVIDSFKAVGEYFGDNTEKKYFVKIDTDTFPIAENLLAYLNKVEYSTKERPALFGKGVCSHPTMCYAAGALYGMNKSALQALNKFFADNPKLHEEEHIVGTNRNLMVHEDFMVSYAYRSATGYPIISNVNIFNYHINREGVGSESHPPVCYHKVKKVDGYYEYYSLLYDEDTRKLRNLDEVEALWKEKEENYPYLSMSKISK